MADGAATERTVVLRSGDAALEADVLEPQAPAGMVLFAHGSGSSRKSPRNRQVATTLAEDGLAAVLLDLLTAEEDETDRRTRALRFDIELLAGRLVAALDWLDDEQSLSALPTGLFGASTGAAAALVAAAQRPDTARAVVSRGGRPDLAGESLPHVRAPTLLIVGGADHAVIGMNEDASERMRAERRLEIVPGATHLFEEPGALEEVARLSSDWLRRHLTPPGDRG